MANPRNRSRSTDQARRGFIHAYGLFWDAEEINWTPRAGNGGRFQILGRVGEHRPALQVCDFRRQRGIYVLYDNYGPYYVGLTRADSLGSRLKNHYCRDRHQGEWTRFSWFGFRRVLTGQLADGTQTLGKVPDRLLTDSRWTIGDIEALLIQALGTPGNRHKERFAQADHWTQVMLDDVDYYHDRLDPPPPSRARQRETRRRRRTR